MTAERELRLGSRVSRAAHFRKIMEDSVLNKSLLTGVIAGISIATAGGVASYALLGNDQEVADQTANVTTEQGAAELALSDPTATAMAASAASASTTESAAQEECWEEEVVVHADPRDEHRIAGTAAGALIGGALAKELGDDNDLLTAAGAAAGAFAGRRAQQEYQENNTTTTIERRCAPVGTR